MADKDYKVFIVEGEVRESQIIDNKLKFSTDLLPEPFLSWVHVSDRRICKFYGESCKIQKYSRTGKTRKNETFLFVAIGNKEYN